MCPPPICSDPSVGEETPLPNGSLGPVPVRPQVYRLITEQKDTCIFFWGGRPPVGCHGHFVVDLKTIVFPAPGAPGLVRLAGAGGIFKMIYLV